MQKFPNWHSTLWCCVGGDIPSCSGRATGRFPITRFSSHALLLPHWIRGAQAVAATHNPLGLAALSQLQGQGGHGHSKASPKQPRPAKSQAVIGALPATATQGKGNGKCPL